MKKESQILDNFFKELADFVCKVFIKSLKQTLPSKTSKGNFEKALEQILKHEGGYVNHPLDPGGATNKGITQRTYDDWLKSKNLHKKDVRVISDEEVKEIYYQNYWLKSGADKLESSKLALVVFDTAVLHGVSKAIKYLEESKSNIDKYLDLRQAHYNKIVEKYPERKIFHKGWTNRNEGLRKLET